MIVAIFFSAMVFPPFTNVQRQIAPNMRIVNRNTIFFILLYIFYLFVRKKRYGESTSSSAAVW
jgi:hypothetical protein